MGKEKDYSIPDAAQSLGVAVLELLYDIKLLGLEFKSSKLSQSSFEKLIILCEVRKQRIVRFSDAAKILNISNFEAASLIKVMEPDNHSGRVSLESLYEIINLLRLRRNPLESILTGNPQEVICLECEMIQTN